MHLHRSMASNIYVTNNLQDDRISRFQLVDWINKNCSGIYIIDKVEDLGDGEVYCYLMHKLYPETLNMTRVRRNPNSELDRLKNFKLLQEAFTALKIDMEAPIANMAKKHFKQNYEFGQWFIRFYKKNLVPHATRCNTEPFIKSKRTYKNLEHFKRSISYLTGTRRRIMVRTNHHLSMSDDDFFAILFEKLAHLPGSEYHVESIKNYVVEESSESVSSSLELASVMLKKLQ